MGRYDHLLEYIPYFEEKGRESVSWHREKSKDNSTIIMPHPIYEESVTTFIEKVYDTDLMKSDYMDYIKRLDERKSIHDHIKRSNLEQLKAILTYFIRQERFCDGVWKKAIEEKIFLAILIRLRELTM